MIAFLLIIKSNDYNKIFGENKMEAVTIQQAQAEWSETKDNSIKLILDKIHNKYFYYNNKAAGKMFEASTAEEFQKNLELYKKDLSEFNFKN